MDLVISHVYKDFGRGPVLRDVSLTVRQGETVCLMGPSGLGKTTLAGIIAAEMGVNIRITSGPAIDRAGDLAIAAGAEHRVDLRQLMEHIVLVALRHAAGNDDLFELALFFELRHL